VTARRAAYAALLLLVLAATAAVWRSTHPAEPADPAQRLTAGLRCPACQGESVADSQSPIAAAMRDAIHQQLAAGRRPDQVRQYLVQRYGAGVLATPPARGADLLLWLAPVLVLAAATAAALRGRRAGTGRQAGGRRRANHHPPHRPTVAAPGHRTVIWNGAAAGLLLLIVTIAVTAPKSFPAASGSTFTDPVPDQITLAERLDQQGQYDAAARAYRTALATQPTDDIRLRLAFDLLRSGTAGEAEQLATAVQTAHPDDAKALLVLGLAQRATGSPQATVTLRRFLAIDPNNPAAAEVRRLLGDG
jgi:cytochrome c-type biogenesis protein CcmH/NrfF